MISSANHNKIHPEFAEESKHQSPRFSNFNSANQINHVEEFQSEQNDAAAEEEKKEEEK